MLFESLFHLHSQTHFCKYYFVFKIKVKIFCKFSINVCNFSGFLFAGFKDLTKHHLKYFTGFFSYLSNEKKELPQQGAISETAC